VSTALKLGKTPARRDPRDLRLTRYLLSLPPIPRGKLGHPDLVADTAWGMFANDEFGDCVWAGAAHETVLWVLMAGARVAFTDANVLADYGAVTGFDPKRTDRWGNNPTDQGTDMRQALLYRQKTGILDAEGRRHKIGAFVRIDSIDELKRSIYILGNAAVGVQFPASAMDQFDAGKPWTVVKNSPVEGGHYVPVIGYDSEADLFTCVTWGREHPVAPAFLAKYMDEAYAVLSEEFLSNGKSLEGFDLDQLHYDLAHLGDAVTDEPPAPTPEPPTPQPPTPAPTPPGGDPADEELWGHVQAWAHARHTRCNKTAASAVLDWAGRKGFTT
jgi:hypothetical protein